MEKIEKIWINFEDKLRAFIYNKVHDKIIAQDILQEVFIKIHSKIDTLKDEAKLPSWIYQITRNLIIDYFRKTKKEFTQVQNETEEEIELADNAIMQEALQDMITMMDKMPSEYCQALCMTELEGLSQKEYADRIGISYSGAKSRVQRSRKMLKDMLMNCCHYEFDKYGTVFNISPKYCCCCHPN